MPQSETRTFAPEYDWQKQRLKSPDKTPLPGCGLVRGYGPNGTYSLYLPTNSITRRLHFTGGKPSVITETGKLESDAIATARDAVLRSATLRDARNVADFLFALQGDISLAAYSAALLALNYDLSDDDLTMLHSGRRWYEPLMQHALGGKDSVEALRRISPETLDRIIGESESQLTRSMLMAAQGSGHGYLVPSTPANPVEIVAEMVASGEVIDGDDELDLASD